VSGAYLLERAWVDGAVHDDVLVEIEDGRFTSVTLRGRSLPFEGVATGTNVPDTRSAGYPDRIPGLTLPGLANCHSHAFHRALRGRTQRERGTFWTWRDQMYAVAATLDPDSYFALARATYREMAAAGVTTVGEFHYLHHQPDGTPYDEPNAMGLALVEAAREAGIRIALLDTCYLSSGFGEPPVGAQLRYSDGSGAAWAARAAQLRRNDSGRKDRDGVVIGAAIHSVRAVPAEQMEAVHAWVAEAQSPLHVHLSEQVAENQACVAEYARTPTEVLADHGLLGPRTTAVHATHLTEDDIRLLGESRTYAGFCPTTERDLGDGIGPSRRLHDAGSPLTLGSDSHAVIDLFEEMRAVELDERLATQQRGHWSAAELLTAATASGQASLGFADAGAIAVGQRADLVTVRTTTPRTAGTGADENTAVFAAVAEDVTQVMVDGNVVVRQGDRSEIGRELDAAVGAIWKGMQ
jgi:formiminoglutamate deiminase